MPVTRSQVATPTTTKKKESAAVLPSSCGCSYRAAVATPPSWMKQAMSDTWEAMSKYSVDKCKKNLDKVFAVEMKKDPHFCDFDGYYYFGTALSYGLYFAKIPDARVHHTFVRFECVPLRIANQVAQWGHPTRTARQHAKLGVPRRVRAHLARI